jgi:predicted ATPase
LRQHGIKREIQLKINSFRMVGIRCFDDTSDLVLGSKFNIFVGQNNAGKSTLLRGILAYQGIPLDPADVRPGFVDAWTTILLGGVVPNDQFNYRPASEGSMRISLPIIGNAAIYNDVPSVNASQGNQIFYPQRPQNILVPFLAKRKSNGFSEAINAGVHTPITGMLQHLYSNIDVLATVGHPEHESYVAASREILGLTITTKPSNGGKVAGFYLDSGNFITLDRMGDGVTEIVALITELCLARNKIFVLEEPETNLHPRGLKALLNMVRASAEHNQFFIATHSNVVVRELGADDESVVYRVYREGNTPQSASRVEKVESTPADHMRLLRELGYEFTDFDLHEGWLFLEESSAERIIRDILIPHFVPKLRGRLRTFSAAGVDNLEPSVSEFRRLITFVHLQPAYEDRLWVRADGDHAGAKVIEKMRITFPDFDTEVLSTFQQPQFELYYPEMFKDQVAQVLAIEDKRQRRQAKTDLLQRVLDWTTDNKDDAKAAWATSAAEVIGLLRSILKKL